MTTASRPPTDERTTDAWREALQTRRTLTSSPASAAGATRRPVDVSRRRFIIASFWAGLGTTLLGSVGLLLDFLYPRNVAGFGGPVAAGSVKDLPSGGEPRAFVRPTAPYLPRASAASGPDCPRRPGGLSTSGVHHRHGWQHRHRAFEDECSR